MAELALPRTANVLQRAKMRFETSFYLQALALLVFYYLSYERWFIRVNPASFPQPSIALDVLGYSKVLLGSFLLGALCAILNYAHVPGNIFYGRLSWRGFQADGEINVRYFVFIVALIIAWAFSSYEFNYFYNQAHLLDRVLLVALAFLMLANPFFAPAFTLFSLIMVAQFYDSGLGAYAWIDKEPVFDMLILSSVFVLLRLFVKVKPSTFLFMALCLHASFYFIPGWAKIRLGPQPWNWVLDNHLHNIFVASYVNGWLGFASKQTILDLANVLKLLDPPLQIFTLTVEFGGIFILVRKRVTPLLLAGWILLYIGIFISSGIFFWKWIAVDAVFLALIWKHWRNDALNRLYNWRYFAVAVVIIAFSPIYFQPSWLAWFDTRLNTVFNFEVVDSAGDVYSVDRGFIAPYDVIFAVNDFNFLNDEQALTETYGATLKFDFAQALENMDNLETLEGLRASYGRNFYNDESAQNFDRFIQTYFRNLNAGVERRALPLFPFAPHHINSFPPAPLDGIRFPIRTVRVRFVEAYYTGDDIVTVQDKIIREIDIDQDE